MSIENRPVGWRTDGEPAGDLAGTGRDERSTSWFAPIDDQLRERWGHVLQPFADWAIMTSAFAEFT
jgi:hypothetical protein